MNVDLRGEPDLVWDLNKYPYPLPRDYFEYIFATDVVEHLDNVQVFMEEVHGLLAPGGIVEIVTPHFSCANSYTDPTHRQHLGYFSFDYFTDASQWNFYSTVRFQIEARVLAFHGRLADRLIAKLANRYPEIYEQRFAWIWPAWFLLFKLRALKNPV